MVILLTNDDGVHAAGIQTLYKVLKDTYTVFVLAPDGERSACSNALTIRQELVLQQLDTNIYSLSGYTSDCINVGLYCDFIPPVDLVISGINHGQNVADDIIYSGTVAGARTAFINNTSGIAISVNSYGNTSDYFHDAACFIAAFVKKHGKQLASYPLFYNINYPDIPSSRISGVQYTSVGKKHYYEDYTSERIDDNRFSLNLKGKYKHEKKVGTDVHELLNNNISITPMTLQYTNHEQLNKLKDMKPIYDTK